VDQARSPVSVRLSHQERAAVTAAAEERGQAPSAFLRRAALAVAGRPLPAIAARRDALAQETARAVGELGRIGNLLNQVARVANTCGLRDKDATFALDRISRELAAVRAALLRQPGNGCAQ
jgi:hypothetical protein